MQRSRVLRSCISLYSSCLQQSGQAAGSSISSGPSTSACLLQSAAWRTGVCGSGPARSLHTLLPSLQSQQSLAVQGRLDLSQGLQQRIATSARQAQQMQQQQPGESRDSLELTTEKIHAITDKIPQRPVTVVEGASYSVIILAAFGVLAFVLYHFIFNFIIEPTALQCFNYTLNKLKADPRVTVRLGSTDDIRAWGSNSTSRVARQQVPHQIYKDASGTEHVRIQFYMKGPAGTGLVNADMYRDPLTKGEWAYTYLMIDVYSGSNQTPSRLFVVRPQ